MDFKGRYRHQSQHKVTANGFTMVEVLIAGILMASALAAVARLSVAALSVSAHSSKRASMEAAINDNIQTMQKEDSYFTREWIKDNADYNFEEACKYPPKKLGKHLQSADQYPRLIVHLDSDPGPIDDSDPDDSDSSPIVDSDSSPIVDSDSTPIVDSDSSPIVDSENKPITRTFDFSTIPGILKIIYSFEGPEKQIGNEIRVIEINPNFASQCYRT